MKSPCISVCKFDDEVCRGCGRTRKEIKGWKSMDNEEHRLIMAESAMRLIVLQAKGRRINSKR